MSKLPKGSLVHFGGMPFRLLEDVETNGLESNYKLAVEMDDGHLTNPDHVYESTGPGSVDKSALSDEAKKTDNADYNCGIALLSTTDG